MNIDKVYLGNTNDGNERLLYVNTCKVCGVTIYTDLNTKEHFKITELNKSSLIPFNYILSGSKYKFKRKVINEYKKNEVVLYHVDNLFIGNISEVRYIPDDYITKHCHKNNIPMEIKDCACNVLLVKLCDTEYRVLGTSSCYNTIGCSSLRIGDLCVSRIKSVKKEDMDLSDGVFNKNQILSKHYQKYKE